MWWGEGHSGTSGAQTCHICGIRCCVSCRPLVFQVCSSYGGVQNGSRGCSGLSPSPDTPPPGIDSHPTYSVRKPVSYGNPQGVVGGGGCILSWSSFSTPWWVWWCVWRDRASNSTPHSGHLTCYLIQSWYFSPSPAIRSIHTSINIPPEEWHV